MSGLAPSEINQYVATSPQVTLAIIPLVVNTTTPQPISGVDGLFNSVGTASKAMEKMRGYEP